MKTQIVSKRFTKYILCSIVLLVGLTSVVSAQGNSPIEVTIEPQAEQAVAGEFFRYTIVVENTSSAPVRETVVSISVPDSAFYFDYNAPAGWLISNPPATGGGIVTFYRPDAMLPNEEEIVELTVEVANELDDPQILNSAFVVLGEENLFETTGDKVDEAEVAVVTPTPTLNNASKTRVAKQTADAEATRIAGLPTATPVPTETPVPTATEVVDAETPSGGFSCLPGMVLISLLFSMMVVTRSNRPVKL
ncbi:hypothetical protein QUF64_16265 [Anaerolineales bacterium HSG6]|nr:hypothetical protein [Anaerolineales bacterium HSG6]